MSLPPDDPFALRADPENPGWNVWELKDTGRFNATLGKLLLRREGDNAACLRMLPGRTHSNLHGSIHGGVLMALADIAIFATARIVLGPQVNGAVTLDMASNFVGSGQTEEPIDATSEVLRETGRFVFLRGLITQGEGLVLSYSATLRKMGHKV